MSQDRWQIINDIFHAALELSGSERRAFVIAQSRGDSELQAEVEKLLEADEAAGSYMERPLILRGVPETHLAPILGPGDILCGRFHVIRMIGEGGMGRVFEAHDSELGVKLALKCINPELGLNTEAAARFRQEVRLARRITHPNVCRTYDLNRDILRAGDGSVHNIMLLTMELLEGETLATKLKRDGPFPLNEVEGVAADIASALAAAHTLGVIHRDIKPANIMLVQGGNASQRAQRTVVMDFGLARYNPSSSTDDLSSLTKSDQRLGTLAYMAPEQLCGRPATFSTDIYAFGLVLFEMITGSRALLLDNSFLTNTGHSGNLPMAAQSKLIGLPENWKRTIQRCLEVSPSMRFQNPIEVIHSLEGTSIPAGGKEAIASALSRQRRKVSIPLRRNLKSLIIGIVTMSLFVLLYRLYWVSTESQVNPGALIYLAQVSNRTNEPSLDNINELMHASLAQSARVNLLDETRVGGILQQMTMNPDTALSASTAREVAMRAGATRVIFAVLNKSRKIYRLDVDVQQPDNSPLRYRHHWTKTWSWHSDQASTEHSISPELLRNVRDASGWIRNTIGEPASDVSRLDVPPEDVTTPSWDALSEYVRGRRLAQDGRIDAAIDALNNAVRIDPQFALAYGDLADLLLTVHREEEGFQAYRKALDPQLERRLSRRERDRLKGMYAIDSWDFEPAVEAFKDYQTFYEHDLLGWIYPNYPLRMLERIDEAMANMGKAIDIAPNTPLVFVDMAILDIARNDLSAARDNVARARKVGHSEDIEALEGSIALLQRRYDDARQAFDSLRRSPNPRARSRSYERLACLLAERGQYQDAIDILNAGMAEDRAGGNPAAQSLKMAARASMEFQLGDFSLVADDLQRAVELDHSPESLIYAESVLGPAIYSSPRHLSVDMRRLAANLQKYQTTSGYGPLHQIAQLRVRGEGLLAQGNAKAASQAFRELDAIEAPVRSREYLGRVLEALAAGERNVAIRRELQTEAKTAYARIALRPWLIWVDPLAYPPGEVKYESDAYLSLGRHLAGTSDEVVHASKRVERQRNVSFVPQNRTHVAVDRAIHHKGEVICECYLGLSSLYAY